MKGNHPKRRNVLKSVATGVGITVSSMTVSASQKENTLAIEPVLRSESIQKILDQVPSATIKKDRIGTDTHNVGDSLLHSADIPTDVGKITYVEGVRNGQVESAAQFNPSHSRAQTDLAEVFGPEVFSADIALFSSTEKAVLSRGPTPAERRAIEHTLDIDKDQIESFTTSEMDGFTVYAFNTQPKAKSDDKTDLKVSELNRYYLVPPDVGEHQHWSVEPTTAVSCDLHCMQCILGLTVSTAGVAGCAVGNWIVCASGLVAGGIITATKCPDCYDCVT